jgi:hypothetical protein
VKCPAVTLSAALVTEDEYAKSVVRHLNELHIEKVLMFFRFWYLQRNKQA